MSACPFCRPNWPNLDIVERSMPIGPAGSVAIVRPLNPVTDGHVLVIHQDHDEHAAATREATRRAAILMTVAAAYVWEKKLQANIMTSIGADATQTVLHTHIHIVPRRPNDGLALPWTEKCGDRMDGLLGDVHYCEKPFGHRGEHGRGQLTWSRVDVCSQAPWHDVKTGPDGHNHVCGLPSEHPSDPRNLSHYCGTCGYMWSSEVQ